MLALAACTESPEITGQIHDDRIELAAGSGPSSLWLSLTNEGSTPCPLMVLDTLDPEDAELDPRRLPVAGGRVVVRTTDPEAEGVQAAMELYAEVDGQPLPLVSSDRPAVAIGPGMTARVQLALSGTPRDGAVRILVCDDPGGYERGRYAVLAFAP